MAERTDEKNKLSKAENEAAENKDLGETAGMFERATNEVLSGRRILRAHPAGNVPVRARTFAKKNIPSKSDELERLEQEREQEIVSFHKKLQNTGEFHQKEIILHEMFRTSKKWKKILFETNNTNNTLGDGGPSDQEKGQQLLAHLHL